MKTIIKISYSENTTSVLADTKIEVEFDQVPSQLDIEDIKFKSKEIFADAQTYALNRTLARRK